jgi:alpha-1,2-glucosyltransferase
MAIARRARPPPFRDNAPMPTSPTPRETWILAIALGLLYVAAIAASWNMPARSDELYHFAQIDLFRHGEWRVLDKYLTTIPGYNAAVAAVLAALHLDSLGAARMVTALFGLIAAAAFHAIRRETQPGTETLATAQFLVLPVLAPFFFLVYTDVLALALILWATFATLRARHVVSALLLSFAILVRQSDVVWAAFLALLVTWPALRARRRNDIIASIRRAIPYLAPVVVFVAFWIENGSISFSHEQAAMHPEFSFHAGNVLLGVVLAGVLLPLQAGAGVAAFHSTLARQRWLFAVPFVAFFAVPFFLVADNPYNGAQPDFFVHNGIVQLVATTPWRFVAAAFATIAVCGLGWTRLLHDGAQWLYPISAFFLAAEWLIETRYLIVPFALWLALREHRNHAIEWTTLALWAVLAVLIVAGTVSGRLFP